jgi:hypothetical protein
MHMSIVIWIAGGLVVVATVAVVLFRAREANDQRDLGSVSRSWTTEHNASHGHDSASR